MSTTSRIINAYMTLTLEEALAQIEANKVSTAATLAEFETLKTSSAKTLEQLKAFNKVGTLNATEKKALEDNIEDLKSKILSKEAIVLEKDQLLRETHRVALESANAARDSLRGRLQELSIFNEMQTAISGLKAFDAGQIVKMFRSDISVKEVDGKESIVFTQNVKGVPTDFSVKDGFDRIKSDKTYFNLFEDASKEGFKSGGGSGGGNETSMTSEQYMDKIAKGEDVNLDVVTITD